MNVLAIITKVLSSSEKTMNESLLLNFTKSLLVCIIEHRSSLERERLEYLIEECYMNIQKENNQK